MAKTIRSPSGDRIIVVSSFNEHLDTGPSDHGSLAEEDKEDLDESDGGVSTALPIIRSDQEPAIDYMLALGSNDSSNDASAITRLRGNPNGTHKENFVNAGNHSMDGDNEIDTISPTYLATRRKVSRSENTQTSIWHSPTTIPQQDDSMQSAMTNDQSLAHGNADNASSDVIMAEDGLQQLDHVSVSDSDDVVGSTGRVMGFIRSSALFPVELSSDAGSGSNESTISMIPFGFARTVWFSESSVASPWPAIREVLNA